MVSHMSRAAAVSSVTPQAEPRGTETVAQETDRCPNCHAPLLVVEQADVCRQGPYFVLRMDCATCGAAARWEYGAAARPRWVRLVVGSRSVSCCSVACGVVALDGLAEDGRLAIEPQPAASAGTAS
jgi:hypothetical protein